MKNKIFLFIAVLFIASNAFSGEDTKIQIPGEGTLELLISPEEISSRIKSIAQEFNKFYENKEIVLVMIMKGALPFVADLIREVKDPLVIEYINASSYTKKSRGELSVKGLDLIELKNKHVLLIDDIFDSGNTLSTISAAIKEKDPASIKTCVLLYKNDSAKVTQLRPDYYLFSIPNKFVVGYGLDYNENFRGLKGIYTLEE